MKGLATIRFVTAGRVIDLAASLKLPAAARLDSLSFE